MPRPKKPENDDFALSGKSVEAIAQKVVELLARPEPGHPGASRALLTPSELARHLGRTRDWVYEHADELGAARVGKGLKPRLLFDPRVVEERLRLKQAPEQRPPAPPHGSHRRPAVIPMSESELLPIGPASRRSRR